MGQFSGRVLEGFGFTGPRGPFFRELVKPFDDPVGPGIDGIEVPVRPAEHFVVFLVIGKRWGGRPPAASNVPR